MKVLYMSHRYHTNQTTIMKGWIENGHEVRFLSQYEGKIEDYTYVKPIVVGYSKFFKIFDYIYSFFETKRSFCDRYEIEIWCSADFQAGKIHQGISTGSGDYQRALHLYDLYECHLQAL